MSSEGIPQYTLDGGVSWTRYSGYLAVTGAADFTSFPVSNQVIVRKGTHALRFQDLSGVAASIEESSNVTLTLVGSNYICATDWSVAGGGGSRHLVSYHQRQGNLECRGSRHRSSALHPGRAEHDHLDSGRHGSRSFGSNGR